MSADWTGNSQSQDNPGTLHQAERLHSVKTLSLIRSQTLSEQPKSQNCVRMGYAAALANAVRCNPLQGGWY